MTTHAVAVQPADKLSDYVFRDGVTHTMRYSGKNAITHNADGKCLSRGQELPERIEVSEAEEEFGRQVAREERGDDRTAWFCTRCLIRPVKVEQPEAKSAPAKTTPKTKRSTKRSAKATAKA